MQGPLFAFEQWLAFSASSISDGSAKSIGLLASRAEHRAMKGQETKNSACWRAEQPLPYKAVVLSGE
jgi:hypothetical protein